MARRREERIPLIVDVRVWGLDSDGKPFSQNAKTVDVTRMGARIRGVNCIRRPGEILGIQYGDEKARFRVVWVGRTGTAGEGTLGLHCVEPEKFIWRSAWPKDHALPAAVSANAAIPTPVPGRATGRRLHQRHKCSGGAQVKREGMASPRWASVSDISLAGCYLETTEPLDPLARVELVVTVEEIEFRSMGVVRTSRPTVGMGISFTEMSAADRDRLDQIIDAIEHKQQQEVMRGAAVTLPVAQPSTSPLEGSVVLPRAAELSIRMQNSISELKEVGRLLSSEKEHVDPRMLRDFQNAITHLRQISWGMQQWIQLKTQNRDPFDVLLQMNTERMRFSTELSKELTMDLEAMELDLTNADIPAFFHNTRKLYRALAKGLGKEEERAAEKEKAEEEAKKEPPPPPPLAKGTAGLD